MEILATSWVLPVARPPLRDARVAVHEGRVVWVGRPGDPGQPQGPLRDLGPGVLLPGLVNAHCHLELSHLAGLARRRRGFVDWIEGVVEERDRAGPDVVRAATREAVRFLEGSTGTVAVADVSNVLAHLDLLASSPLTTVVFYELLGWDPRVARAVLLAADERLARLPPDLSERSVYVRLAAHAPHSVSRPLFEGLLQRGGPAALHLAESPAERRFLASGDGEWAEFLRRRGLGEVAFTPPGMSPVRYADSLGLLRPGLVAAHAVQVDGRDVEILARRGVSVAVCLTSNRSLGVGAPPVPRMLEAGVRLCIGTDSLASGDGLDVMGEVVALHREFPGIEPELLVRMATAGGAEALGLPELGTIAPGKRASFAFAASSEAPRDPLGWLVSGEAGRLARLTA